MTHIQFNKYAFDLQSAQAIGPGLAVCLGLRKIDINFCPMSKGCLEVFMANLPVRLESLVLIDVMLDADGLQALSQSLETRLSHLKHLSLYHLDPTAGPRLPLNIMSRFFNSVTVLLSVRAHQASPT